MIKHQSLNHKLAFILILLFSLFFFCKPTYAATDSKCNKLGNAITNNYVSKITSIKLSASNKYFNFNITWKGNCTSSTCKIIPYDGKSVRKGICTHPTASNGSDVSYSSTSMKSMSVKKQSPFIASCTMFSSSRKCEKYLARYVPKDCSNTKNSYGYIGHQSIDFKFERLIPNYTITVKVKDRHTGNEISGYSNSQTVTKGENATVSGKFDISGYTFDGWDSCSAADNTNCTVSNVTANQTLYVYYKKQVTLTMIPIDINGASLEGIAGLKKSTVSAWQGDTAKVIHTTPTSSDYSFVGWKTSTTGAIVSTGDSYTVSNITADTTVYSVYSVYVEPPMASKLDVKVKNNDVSIYNDFADDNVYARPGNRLTFQANYNPGAQEGYDYTPQKIIIGETATQFPTDGNNTNQTVMQLFNNYRNTSQYGPWTNSIVFDRTYTYTVGDTTSRSETFDYTVEAKDVGKKVQKEAHTQTNQDGATPKGVSFENISGIEVSKVSFGLSDSAKVYIPYNFQNTAEVATPTTKADGSPNSVFAGETASFDIDITVGRRANAILGGDEYATIVSDARWKIGISYNGGSYQWATPISGTLNSSNNINGTTEQKKGLSINIPDLNAGQSVCIKSAVYPKDSHDDLNTGSYDPNDESAWSYSPEKCYVVAKKPSIQILGGNTYSNGSIKTGLSIKKHLQGHNEFSVNTDNTPYIFGSWSELSIIANSGVTGFSSGATLGLGNSGSLPGGYFGNYNFCKLSSLSFANDQCSSGTVGNVGTKSAVSSVNTDKSTIKDLITKISNNGERIEYSDEGIVEDLTGNTDYYHSNGRLIVGHIEKTTKDNPESLEVPKETTKIIHAKDNITISQNIRFENEGYTKLEQSPKLVIYSEKTIVISCEVTQIDAVLLANTVKTCDSDDINAGRNSHPLTIYGAVIASNLIANRSYGAASGDNSIIPAETINFDPTLYLWEEDNEKESGEESGETDEEYRITTDLDIVTIKEIAPRY